MPLIPLADVRNFLPGYNFTDAQLTVTMNVVTSWLKDATGQATVADQTPADPLYAAALELVAMTASNPDLLAAKAVGPTSRTWPLARRRQEILDAVRDGARSAATAPRGHFPPAPAWPDPTRLSQTDDSWIYRTTTP